MNQELLHRLRPVFAGCAGTLLLLAVLGLGCNGGPAGSPKLSDPDARALDFLERRRGSWDAWNVPYADGQAMHDLIVQKGFRRGLEIGTSTGHSTIWIARAMRKTGGRVITLEIDAGRHQKAVTNFRAAGMEPWIDARLADAHEVVPKLEGPFDFVFSDADKDWYIRYFEALHPKMVRGGCHLAHNVNDGFAGVERFMRYVRRRKDYETRIVNPKGRGGIGLSCKK